MLAGPMDYTPGGFNNVTKNEFQPRDLYPMVMGTRSHQTALYVVFESAFQMLSDYPGGYEDQKEIDFLRVVPATWDETRVVNGEPVKYITVARRHGTEWYVGSITDWDARNVDIPLSFLGPGSYTAELYADAPDAATEPKNSVRETLRVDSKTVLKLKLAPGGGAAVRIVPAK
jgi:alpha-glucosidase